MAFSYPTNCSEYICLMQYNNSITGNMFGNMILIAAFAVIFITIMGNDIRKAFAAASWSTFLLSVPLAAVNVSSSSMPVILLALSGISLLPLFLKKAY